MKKKIINTYYVCTIELHRGNTFFGVKCFDNLPKLSDSEELRAKYNYENSTCNFIVCEKKKHFYNEEVMRYYKVKQISKVDVYEEIIDIVI